jgi:PAS domain S-box-containing protein
MKTLRTYQIYLLWLLLLLLSFLWNIQITRKNTATLAFNKSEAFFNQIVLTRSWNSVHGGVYVPVTDETQPNPYLKTILRDIESNDGLKLTQINPAYMTRQIAEINQEKKQVHFHITSLDPIRPANQADKWESEALTSFEQGNKDYFALVKNDSAQLFRYMAPLITDSTCLSCHAQQGYKIGDIRGGISVSFPAEPYLKSQTYQILNLAAAHLLILLAGLFGIHQYISVLRKSFAQREKQNQELAEKNTTLKQLNTDLAEKEAKFRALYEQSPIGIELYNSQGELVQVNPACMEIFGVSDSESLKGFKLFEDPNLSEDQKALLQKGQSAYYQVNFDFELVKKHKLYPTNRSGQIWLDVMVSPIARPISAYLVQVQDISRQKSTEAALSESEAHFRALFSHSPVSIFIHDIETGEIIDANQNACESFDFQSLEELKKNDFWMESPYAFEDARKMMEKTLAEGPQNYEWLSRKRNGQLFWEKVHLTTIDLSGKKRILATTVDITEQKNVEAELARHEAQFRRIIESLPFSLTIVTLDGVILYANSKAFEFFEIGKDIVGQKKAFVVWVDPKHRDIWIDEIQKNGIVTDFEMHMQTQSGRKLWAVGNGLIINYQGQDCILSTQHDITYRKMMEDAIAESEEKFRILAENASAGIYLVYQEKLIYVNQGLADMLGYTQEEMNHTEFIRYIDPSYKKMTKERAAARVKGEDVPKRYELKLLTKNGDTRWVELNAAITTLKGKTINIGTIFDITERYHASQALYATNRKLETALKQLKEAQEKVVKQERLTAVGQVTAGIAHDFNNILSSILGFAELMEYRADDSQSLSNLRHIKTAGKRAAKLVQQLLDFTSKGLRRPKPLDLALFLIESKTDIAEFLSSKIQLEYELPDEACIIEADSDQLQQIVTNISANAKDALENGGIFKISLTKANFSGDDPCVICNELIEGDYFRISFQDDGAGISPANLPHIFEPFFTTKEIGQGTGLGLSQVFGIVSQYEGHITIESKLGIGTTLHIYWPPEKSAANHQKNHTHKKSDDGRWS